MRRRLRLLLRWGAALAALLLLAGLVAAGWAYLRLRGSLPSLDGEVPLAGLRAPVRIERDALGIPDLHGASRVDLARATGWLHAQERFFQMDLMRRRSAGELAELFGPAALEADREVRVHRFRHRARRGLAFLDERESGVLEAYAEGVNAGLGALAAPPFEYLLLRSDPSPWRIEDSLLVTFSMHLDLQDEMGIRESSLGVLHDLLPPEMARFLAPAGTEWDAPVTGEPFPTPPVPGPEVFSLREAVSVSDGPRARFRHGPAADRLRPGSNSWVISGTRTAHGAPIVANDPHLPIRVPHIWYRLSIAWSGPGGEDRRATGVTIPGSPHVIVGSNGRVAWGFTNSQGDWADLVILEPDSPKGAGYLAPDGPRPFARDEERIRVKGGEDETLEVLSTIWGPVIDQDHRGRRRALRWVAHDPEGVRGGFAGLERARNIEEALVAAARCGAPGQNMVAADAGGRIAWTLLGPIPRRVGHDGSLPRSWAGGPSRWEGYLEPDEYPRVVDPERGFLWTANARVVDGEMLRILGDGGYDLGARARQIRDSLAALEQADERSMLAIQLDIRALFLQRWRDFLLEVLTPEAVAADPRRGEMRGLVEDWGARALPASAGYRMVRAFRSFLAGQVFGSLTARCEEADDRFDFFRIGQSEGPLWRLVDERPLHLLDPRHSTWEDQFLAAVDETLDYFEEIGPDLAARTWGERNRARFRHPMSAFIPGGGMLLDLPAHPLPGDSHMPRVQTPTFGASMRMAVSPGREEDGYMHMPGGQSGHPLSPYYRAGHEDWVAGEATSFLPGPPVHTLVLRPAP